MGDTLSENDIDIKENRKNWYPILYFEGKSYVLVISIGPLGLTTTILDIWQISNEIAGSISLNK